MNTAQITNSIKASLITCHHSDDFRVIKEIEGSGNRYFSSNRETKSYVRIIPATDELLKKELAKLSIFIDDLETLKKVAHKFYFELTSLKDGKLAWDQCKNNGFYEIL